MDHSPTAYGTIDLMANNFEHVILVTPRTQIAQLVNYCSAIGVHRRLHKNNVDIVTSFDLIDFKGGVATCRNVFTGDERSFFELDFLVYATPRQAADVLANELKDAVELHLVGDCQSPRNLMSAIHGGHFVGCAL